MDSILAHSHTEHLGSLSWYQGIEVTRDRATKELWLSQKAYIEKIASTFEIQTTQQTTPHQISVSIGFNLGESAIQLGSKLNRNPSILSGPLHRT